MSHQNNVELPTFATLDIVGEPWWSLSEIGIAFDADAQLRAIHGLLERHKAAEAELAAQHQAATEHARMHPDEVDPNIGEYLDGLLWDADYQGAAHSMAAVGMLAPFLETVFYQCFRGIGTKCKAAGRPIGQEHERMRAANAIKWDCHMVVENGKARKDITEGILQLAEAIGLSARLPQDIRQTLSALFGYRNKMVHLGLEWPLEERRAFQKLFDKKDWRPEWFDVAKSGDDPWVFYMSEAFIEHCLVTARAVLRAFGEYVTHDLSRK